MPISIPGRGAVLVPFAIESDKGAFDSRDPFASQSCSVAAGRVSASSNDWGWGGAVRWHNAIIRDIGAGKEWTILDRRGVISAWKLMGPRPRRPEDPYRAAALMFFGTVEDTNKDGALNDQDAQVAIVTDGDGSRPRVVTPPNVQVRSAYYDEATNRIFLLLVPDSRGDGTFDYSNPPAPYMVDVSGSAPAVPVVSEETLRKVEALLK